MSASEPGPSLQRPFPYDPAAVKVVACATVIEEMAPRMPPTMAREVMDFGLHFRPGGLTAALQEVIDRSEGFETILLGYGLCSNGVVGLKATTARLVVPRVDDCIAIFLGSREAYGAQHAKEPGTYFLTKGWIEARDSPLDTRTDLVARYGEAKADRVMELMLRNYTRIMFIDTGAYELEQYRAFAKENAEHFDLRFEEVKGSPALVEKLLFGPWDEECVVVEPGGEITYQMFVRDGRPPTPQLPGFGRA